MFFCGPAMYMFLALVVGVMADKFVSSQPQFHTDQDDHWFVYCSKGTRGFIVCGFLISGVSFLLVGPAHFIAKP